MSYLANQCRCNYFIDILNSFRDTYRGQADRDWAREGHHAEQATQMNTDYWIQSIINHEEKHLEFRSVTIRRC